MTTAYIALAYRSMAKIDYVTLTTLLFWWFVMCRLALDIAYVCT